MGEVSLPANPDNNLYFLLMGLAQRVSGYMKANGMNLQTILSYLSTQGPPIPSRGIVSSGH